MNEKLKNILLTEDSKLLCESYSFIIQKELGIKIDIAHNYMDAMKLVLAKDYGTYIVDGNFPVKEGEQPIPLGIDLAFDIMKNKKDSHIIMHTGDLSLEQKIKEANLLYFPKDGSYDLIDYLKEYQKIDNVLNRQLKLKF